MRRAAFQGLALCYQCRHYSITRSLLGELRKATNFPLVTCKAALEATNYTSIGAAIKWLKTQPAPLLKSSPQENSSSGLVALAFGYPRPQSFTISQIKCGTQLTANTELFQSFCNNFTYDIHRIFYYGLMSYKRELVYKHTSSRGFSRNLHFQPLLSSQDHPPINAKLFNKCIFNYNAISAKVKENILLEYIYTLRGRESEMFYGYCHHRSPRSASNDKKFSFASRLAEGYFSHSNTACKYSTGDYGSTVVGIEIIPDELSEMSPIFCQLLVQRIHRCSFLEVFAQGVAQQICTSELDDTLSLKPLVLENGSLYYNLTGPAAQNALAQINTWDWSSSPDYTIGGRLKAINDALIKDSWFEKGYSVRLSRVFKTTRSGNSNATWHLSI